MHGRSVNKITKLWCAKSKMLGGSGSRRCRWKLGVTLTSDISVSMSLYYDAASVLSPSSQDGSLKSRIYNSKNFKSKPANIYALISETAKYDGFLKELIENSGILALEPKVCNQPLRSPNVHAD